MEQKRILIFTGKFPASGDDIDGGSILIKTLIDALKNKCILDVIFIRRYNSEFEKIQGVNSVSFLTYKKHPLNKFERRLVNKEQVFTGLKEKISFYDNVIITHCCKAFGIENLPEKEKEKIILFPMYLSPSYQKSGENPPEEYIKNERLALNSVKKIITPSENEKQDMINIFNIESEKITVIPRGYSDYIQQNIEPINNKVNLLYIASIKSQKNTLESLVILNKLIKKGKNVYLNLVGSCQDEKIYLECLEYIKKENLNEHVIFHGTVNQKKLAEIINECNINISVSNWETFGRGIFEGMAGGLPTVIYEHIECVKQYLVSGKGILFVKNIDTFVESIIKLIEDKEFYYDQAIMALNSVQCLSEQHEKKLLAKEILKCED